MKFSSEEETRRFIRGEKFYKNKDCYCLGNSLEDAGEIFRYIIADIEKENTECGNG